MSKNEELLWHYTSFEVLTSIFKKPDMPTMRASHIAFLNDSSEYKYGMGKIIEFEKSIFPESINEKNSENYISRLEHLPDVYTFSLSAAVDSLYQWHVYSPKEGGISLGFARDFTTLIPLQGGEKFSHSHIATVNEVNYLRPEEKYTPEQTLHGLGINYGALMTTKAVLIKHSAFEFEKEHRVFIDARNLAHKSLRVDVKFTAKKPYIEFPFNPFSLQKIYISPRGDKYQTEKLVKLFIKQHHQLAHIKDEDIIVSDIPYRD